MIFVYIHLRLHTYFVYIHTSTDMIFILREIQEKCREPNLALYAAFMDLAKAFDTVRREGLWRILGKLGCPPRFLSFL